MSYLIQMAGPEFSVIPNLQLWSLGKLLNKKLSILWQSLEDTSISAHPPQWVATFQSLKLKDIYIWWKVEAWVVTTPVSSWADFSFKHTNVIDLQCSVCICFPPSPVAMKIFYVSVLNFSHSSQGGHLYDPREKQVTQWVPGITLRFIEKKLTVNALWSVWSLSLCKF